jgi:hypothetical protein
MPKEKITIWVPTDVAKTLRAKAVLEKDDLSPVVARVVAKAVADGVEGSPRYAPAVEAFKEAVSAASRGAMNAVAADASKAALYAIASRLEGAHLLEKKFGTEQGKRIAKEAWRKAIELLRKDLEVGA